MGVFWSEDGRFVYFRPKVFDENESRQYFQGTKYFSFVRRLYRFHFDRILQDEKHPAGVQIFQHVHFQRGKPELLHLVVGDNKRMYSRAIRSSPGTTKPTVLKTKMLVTELPASKRK